MKVFVLGGTGFLGSHVARAFHKAGHEVAVGVRPRSPRDLLADVPVEFVPADLHQPDSLLRAFTGREVVVHAAGILSLWEKDKETLYQTNVLGTRNVVNACRQADVKRLICDGSAGIYAGTASPQPVNEQGAPDAARFHSFHVVSMCLAEREVLQGLADGLDVIRLHPTLCVGEGDRNFHSSWPLLALSQVGLSFSPPGGLNLVDVLDAAHAHVLALDAPRGGNYLIGGENLTNGAYMSMLREVLKRRGLDLPISRRGLSTLGGALEWVSRLTGEDHGQYVTLNRALAEAMSLYWFVDDSRARTELGHSHSPLRSALERQLNWLQESGLLSGPSLSQFLKRFLRAPRH